VSVAVAKAGTYSPGVWQPPLVLANEGVHSAFLAGHENTMKLSAPQRYHPPELEAATKLAAVSVLCALCLALTSGGAASFSEARPARVLRGGEVRVAQANSVNLPVRVISGLRIMRGAR
jgi:hypothetical protein